MAATTLRGRGGRKPQTLQKLPQTTQRPAAAGGAPFIEFSRRHAELAFDTGALAYGTIFGPRDIPAIGFFRDLFMDVNVAGGNGGTTAAVYNFANNAPFNDIASMQLLDITGTTLTDISSYDLFLINCFGGYRFWPDPRQYPFASNVAASAAAAATGNHRYQLIMPAELLADAYASIPNENAAAALKMRIQFETAGNVFSTQPAPTVPTVDVRADLDVWTRPANGMEPPGLGTTAYWSKQIYTTVTGLNTIRLVRVGNYIHTLIVYFRNSTPANYDINSTAITDLQLRVDGVPQIGPTTYLKHWTEIYQDYGFLTPQTTPGAPNAANQPFLGALVFSFRNDVGHPDRGESAELWMPTTGATRLEIALTLPAGGASGTMTVLTGDVIPEGAVEHLPVS